MKCWIPACGASLLICLRPLLAAEAPSEVTVPSAKAAVHLAVPLPGKLASGESGLFTLTEVDHPEVVVPAQRIAAMAPDGTVAEAKSCLAASIPPRPARVSDAGSARVSDPAETADRRSPISVLLAVLNLLSIFPAGHQVRED